MVKLMKSNVTNVPQRTVPWGRGYLLEEEVLSPLPFSFRDQPPETDRPGTLIAHRQSQAEISPSRA